MQNTNLLNLVKTFCNNIITSIGKFINERPKYDWNDLCNDDYVHASYNNKKNIRQ